jgi:hypothetical protein
MRSFGCEDSPFLPNIGPKPANGLCSYAKLLSRAAMPFEPPGWVLCSWGLFVAPLAAQDPCNAETGEASGRLRSKSAASWRFTVNALEKFEPLRYSVTQNR